MYALSVIAKSQPSSAARLAESPPAFTSTGAEGTVIRPPPAARSSSPAIPPV